MVAFPSVSIRICTCCCFQLKLDTNASNLRNVMVFSGNRRLFVGKRRYKSSHLSLYSHRTAASVYKLSSQCGVKSMFLSVLYFGISRMAGDGDTIAAWHDNLLWAYNLYGVCIIWCREIGVQRSVCLLRFPILITRLSFDMTAYCTRSTTLLRLFFVRTPRLFLFSSLALCQ